MNWSMNYCSSKSILRRSHFKNWARVRDTSRHAITPLVFSFCFRKQKDAKRCFTVNLPQLWKNIFGRGTHTSWRSLGSSTKPHETNVKMIAGISWFSKLLYFFSSSKKVTRFVGKRYQLGTQSKKALLLSRELDAHLTQSIEHVQWADKLHFFNTFFLKIFFRCGSTFWRGTWKISPEWNKKILRFWQEREIQPLNVQSSDRCSKEKIGKRNRIQPPCEEKFYEGNPTNFGFGREIYNPGLSKIFTFVKKGKSSKNKKENQNAVRKKEKEVSYLEMKKLYPSIVKIKKSFSPFFEMKTWLSMQNFAFFVANFVQYCFNKYICITTAKFEAKNFFQNEYWKNNKSTFAYDFAQEEMKALCFSNEPWK